MKKSDEIKEKIIGATTELIAQSNGDINSITTRAIVEEAGVGVGLINYHFQTKDKLIEICVQRVIENVILEFKPIVEDNLSATERLKVVTKAVMDFLINNPSVSRISILGDYHSPQIFDNTMKTVQGLTISLESIAISDDDKKLLLFGLTSILQAMFLRKEMSKQLLGYDFSRKEERDMVIDFYIESLFSGKAE